MQLFQLSKHSGTEWFEITDAIEYKKILEMSNKNENTEEKKRH